MHWHTKRRTQIWVRNEGITDAVAQTCTHTAIQCPDSQSKHTLCFGQTLNGPTSPQPKNLDPSLSISSSSILSTLESTGPHCTTFSSLIPISCLSSCPSFRRHSICLNDLSRRGSSWMGRRLSASHSSREPNPWTSKQNVTSRVSGKERGTVWHGEPSDLHSDVPSVVANSAYLPHLLRSVYFKATHIVYTHAH